MATGALPGCSMCVSEEEFSKTPKNFECSDLDRQVYPATRNSELKRNRAITEEHIAAPYNNFYECSEAKDDIWKRVGDFKPWSRTLESKGLVHKPQFIDVVDFFRIMPMEERLYRHRCVEPWTMAVPWKYGF